jgi:peptide/nickel transport system permease protein
MARSDTASAPTLHAVTATAIARRRHPLWLRLLRNRRVVLGFVVLLVMYLAALFAPLVAPDDPNEQVLISRLKPPSWQHLLGTDTFGRDIFSRAVWGARVSLSVSLTAMLIIVVIGTTVGVIAGFFGGWMDNVIMRATDMLIAFPIFILLITIVAIYGSSKLLLPVFLGLASWPHLARLVRGQVLSLSNADFVLAGRVIGASNTRIMLAYILPNIVSVLVVAATLQVAAVILIEASLSYFGLGVPPPDPTWGNMVAEGRLVLNKAWWVTTFPGTLVVMTVLAYNLLGDGLRDVLDPRRAPM